jgi:L-iditol 2-dehydrogenase
MVEPLACVVRGVEACALRPGDSAAVVGVGAIGLMFVALLRDRGVRVVVAGRSPQRLRRAIEMGASAAVAAAEGSDLARELLECSPEGRGFHAVVEAAGGVATSEAATRAVRKGGRVNLFGGCPAEARVSLDVARLHYDEVTVLATFHHTPASVREALRLIADGRVDPEAFITGEAPLDRLPDVLHRMAHGEDGLKTAILP